MNCEAVKELLWAYLEKETTAEEAEKIEKHLAECADCREELEAQKAIMESLASLPEAELPEGYHTELMQKLQAEAAPNVVPFPVKKKKQPMYKQWGMIAAAVLVVVAAGGMNGMLEMRESQNAVTEEMKTKQAAVPEIASDNGMIVYDTIEDVTEDYLGDMDASEITVYSSRKMNAPASGAATVTAKEETTAAYDPSAVVTEASAMDTMEEEMQFSVARIEEGTPMDIVTLSVSDTAAAVAELQKAIAEAGGYEEAAEEGSIFAVIPVEHYGDFVKAAETVGALEWNQKGKLEEGAAYRTMEILLKRN